MTSTPPSLLDPSDHAEDVLEAIIRKTPDDFVVDEIPIVEPEGEGEHLWVEVWKRGLDTMEVRRRLARAARVSERSIGLAGRKDRYAVTRQWFSLPAAAEVSLLEAGEEGAWRVLREVRNGRKLRLGWLRGNRFQLTLRELPAGVITEIARRAEALSAAGVPNAFGPQRFGREGDNHEVGRLLLAGDADGLVRHCARERPERDAPHVKQAREALAAGALDDARFPPAMVLERLVVGMKRAGKGVEAVSARLPRRTRDLLVSAYQSEGFNRVLLARLRDGPDLEEGDVVGFPDGRTVFHVEDVSRERERLQAGEIVTTGPLPGTRGLQPSGPAAERELARLGSWASCGEGPLAPPGTRRTLVLPGVSITCESLEEDPRAVRLGFELPAGSFATSLLTALGIRTRDPV